MVTKLIGKTVTHAPGLAHVWTCSSTNAAGNKVGTIEAAWVVKDGDKSNIMVAVRVHTTDEHDGTVFEAFMTHLKLVD